MPAPFFRNLSQIPAEVACWSISQVSNASADSNETISISPAIPRGHPSRRPTETTRDDNVTTEPSRGRGSVTHQVKPACYPSSGVRQPWSFRSVSTSPHGSSATSPRRGAPVQNHDAALDSAAHHL